MSEQGRDPAKELEHSADQLGEDLGRLEGHLDDAKDRLKDHADDTKGSEDEPDE